jgi:hypothetical protein
VDLGLDYAFGSVIRDGRIHNIIKNQETRRRVCYRSNHQVFLQTVGHRSNLHVFMRKDGIKVKVLANMVTEVSPSVPVDSRKKQPMRVPKLSIRAHAATIDNLTSSSQ